MKGYIQEKDHSGAHCVDKHLNKEDNYVDTNTQYIEWESFTSAITITQKDICQKVKKNKSCNVSQR